MSPSGRFVLTSNTGPGRNSLTLLERRSGGWEVRQILPRRREDADDREAEDEDDWRGVFMGLAFAGDRGFYASEGNSGRVAYFDNNGERRRAISLNSGDF